MKLGFYPDVVNENATRIVAGTIVFLTSLALVLPHWILVSFLFLGFLLRLSYGPKLEPTAWLVANWVVPTFKISFLPTAGPPKRFAQLIGTLFALSALGLLLTEQLFLYKVVLGILVFFASLEAFVGWCAGCFFFRLLMKTGLIPEEVCERCNNLKFDSLN